YALNAGVLRYSSVLLEQGDSSLIQDWLRDGSTMELEKQYMIKEILSKYISFNYPEIENIYLMSLDKRVLQAYGYSSGFELANQSWYSLPMNSQLEIIPTYYGEQQAYPVLAVAIPIY